MIQPRLHKRRRDLISMQRCKVLLNLLTAPMPMHVTPASNIHQHVEDEGVAAAEFFDEFVVGSSCAHGDIDHLLLLFLLPGADDREKLPIGSMGNTIQQRG